MEGKENTKGASNSEEIEDDDDDDQSVAGATVDNGTDDTKTGKDDKKSERSFTQSQVNRMMTREKNQGRAAAYKEMGIDPKDGRMVKMFRAFIESQKTDDQKDAEKEIEAKKEREEIERRAVMAEAKAEAMMIGVKSQYVDDAVTLALSKMSDDADMKTLLGELKEKYSIWFEDDGDGDGDSNPSKKNDYTGKTGQKGTGATMKESARKGGKDTGGLGARLAAQRKATSSKHSYWGGDR